MMLSNDVNALLSDDLIHRILLGLPVITLLRFKCVCKSWCALIESAEFTKHHLRHQHYDYSSLKDENHNLIIYLPTNNPPRTICLPTNSPPLTFLVTSVHNFEAPIVYLQLDFPMLHEYTPAHVAVIFDGIVCSYIEKWSNSRHNTICLWNPATKQHRVLPLSPYSITPQSRINVESIVVGFGFDAKTNDYKVVKLIKNHFLAKNRVEVYSLSTNSWRNIGAVFPVDDLYPNHPRRPFHNGSWFCWRGCDSESRQQIVCFDFSSETFRSLSFPDTDHDVTRHLSIVSDKIVCIISRSEVFGHINAEVWMLNGYGSISESWAILFNIDDPCFKIDRRMSSVWISMVKNIIFFGYKPICGYNMATEEIKYFSALESQENVCCIPNMGLFHSWTVAEFKESLMSVGGRNEPI